MKQFQKAAMKDSVERISSKISSSIIVDQNDFMSANPIGKVKNMFKTRLILNQTESFFIDFKRKEFPNFARDRYYTLQTAFKRKDKVDLMKLLSIPLYDIFKDSLKNKVQPPFTFYPHILDASLVQGQLFIA